MLYNIGILIEYTAYNAVKISELAVILVNPYQKYQVSLGRVDTKCSRWQNPLDNDWLQSSVTSEMVERLYQVEIQISLRWQNDFYHRNGHFWVQNQKLDISFSKTNKPDEPGSSDPLGLLW